MNASPATDGQPLEQTLSPGAFPVVAFDRIDDAAADNALVAWGHWLGACNRPFGRQSFGLFIEQALLAVAVSASTVNGHCGGFDRAEVVELARLCAHPHHRDLTRVALRLWRKISPGFWSGQYWPVVALVAYSDSTRHTGDLYRFDGWKKVADARGSEVANWGRGKRRINPKRVWAFRLVG